MFAHFWTSKPLKSIHLEIRFLSDLSVWSSQSNISCIPQETRAISLRWVQLTWKVCKLWNWYEGQSAACSTSFFNIFPSFTFIARIHLKVKRAWSQNGTFILAFLSLSSSSVCLLPGTFSFNSPQTNMIHWLHGFKCMNTERMANTKMCVTGGGGRDRWKEKGRRTLASLMHYLNG